MWLLFFFSRWQRLASLSGYLMAADWRYGVLLTEATEQREMRLPLPAQNDTLLRCYK